MNRDGVRSALVPVLEIPNPDAPDAPEAPEPPSSPDAPPQGTNSGGKVGWYGPCPPSGTHHYNFTLLALDLSIDQGGAPKADDIRRAAEGHTLAQAVLTGTFKRG